MWNVDGNTSQNNNFSRNLKLKGFGMNLKWNAFNYNITHYAISISAYVIWMCLYASVHIDICICD